MSEREFVKLLVTEDKMQGIMTMIRYIDKEKNGCVTTSEMDDILREVYPTQLKGKCFKHILKVFTAI
jgi:Ca2+-binding EF-hand superfamily protein